MMVEQRNTMTTVLQLNASMFSAHGQSTQLAEHFVAGLRDRDPSVEVVVRDLASDPVPHLTAERFAAFQADQPTDAQREVVALSDALIAELQRADTIVLGLPMYNFGVPSTLRAYFDHVARAKVTFRYTEHGPEGLLKNKKAYVIATRGGKHGTNDSVTNHVRDILGFLGITDVEFVYAEGLAMGEANKQDALTRARAQLDSLHTAVAHAA
jgi:FMN-dependent NADH-azoreductase